MYRKVDMDVYNNSLVIPMNTQEGGVQFEDKNSYTYQRFYPQRFGKSKTTRIGYGRT